MRKGDKLPDKPSSSIWSNAQYEMRTNFTSDLNYLPSSLQLPVERGKEADAQSS